MPNRLMTITQTSLTNSSRNRKLLRRTTATAALIIMSIAAISLPHAQTSPALTRPISKETRVTTRATGAFEVKMAQQPLVDVGAEPMLGRMSLDKTFSGDLQGTGKGEMLMAGTETKGSAGYVAIERVSGTLHGRTGTFVLQHTGTMNRGAPQLSVTVVPDSGTGQLAGLAGTLNIIIAGGKHSYEFDYSLPAQ
jgi:hypothetical protein